MATTIKIHGDTHNRLRQLTLKQSAQRNVRLTMEQVLTGLLNLADEHPRELTPVITVRDDDLSGQEGKS